MTGRQERYPDGRRCQGAAARRNQPAAFQVVYCNSRRHSATGLGARSIGASIILKKPPYTISTYGGVGGCVKKARKRRAVRKMKVDPSEPSCRGRLQTAMSCFVPMAGVVNVMVKRRDFDYVM